MTEVDHSEGGQPPPLAALVVTVPDPEPPRRLPLVVRVLPLVAVIAVIVVIAVLVFRPLDDAGTSAEPAPFSAPFLSGGVVQGETDDFDRSDSRTELSDAGELSWIAERGTWAVEDGSAFASDIPDEFVVAVTDTEAPIVGVQARMNQLVEQSGLAFAYTDDDDFLAILAAPGYGSWGLWSRQNGSWVYLDDIGLAPTVDGTVVGVVVEDGEARVYLDGDPFGDPLPLGDHAGTGGGLVSFAVPDGRNRFDDVVVATSD